MSKDPFIKQTAKDYDLEYDIVAEIMRSHPVDYYKALEAAIKGRANG